MAKRAEEMTDKEMVVLVASAAKKFEDAADVISDLDERLRDLHARVDRGELSGGSFTNTTHRDKERWNKASAGLRESMRSGNLSLFLNAMQVNPSPSGGYVVHPMLEPGISRIARDVSPFRALARTRTLTEGDAWEEPFNRDAAAASWVGETESRTETATPTLGVTRVPLHEIYAAPRITQKLVDTASFPILDWIIEAIGIAFAETESAAFFTGNGVGRPRGFLTHTLSTADDSSRTWGEIQYLPSTANGAFAAAPNSGDVFYDCIGKLKTTYRAAARWLMNRATIALTKKMKDSDGHFIWQDSLQAGQPPMLAGYPVIEDEQMPDPAANSLSVAFGSWSDAYVIPEMPGLKLLLDPFTAKPYVVAYGYRRVGGGVRNSDALKLIRLSVA